MRERYCWFSGFETSRLYSRARSLVVDALGAYPMEQEPLCKVAAEVIEALIDAISDAPKCGVDSAIGFLTRLARDAKKKVEKGISKESLGE